MIVARFFFTGLDICATKVQISKTLEPPRVDSPDSAKSSGWYSMNTQKMVVKHLVQN